MAGFDERFDRLMERLVEKSSTHPNVANVWRTHLQLRKKKMEGELERCETILDQMTDQQDIPLEVLRDLSVLVSLFCNNNT
jgi:hypothetical protein